MLDEGRVARAVPCLPLALRVLARRETHRSPDGGAFLGRGHGGSWASHEGGCVGCGVGASGGTRSRERSAARRTRLHELPPDTQLVFRVTARVLTDKLDPLAPWGPGRRAWQALGKPGCEASRARGFGAPSTLVRGQVEVEAEQASIGRVFPPS